MSLQKSDLSLRYLTGHILCASPFVEDADLVHSVIFVCGHDENGAMGLILNRPLPSIKADDVIRQLNLDQDDFDVSIVSGGDVDRGRGFVLHTAEYTHSSTIPINDQFSLTATLDILHNMAQGQGPKQAILALGYMAWDHHKLEEDVQKNLWLSMPATPEFVFHTKEENMWEVGLKMMHITPSSLVMEGGHA